MTFRNLLLCLLHVINAFAVTGNINCKANRPVEHQIQSAVCCYPTWKVMEKPQFKTKSKVNLDELISSFALKTGSSSWFVEVTNFLRVPLHNSKYPFLLRWPVPVWEKRYFIDS